MTRKPISSWEKGCSQTLGSVVYDGPGPCRHTSLLLILLKTGSGEKTPALIILTAACGLREPCRVCSSAKNCLQTSGVRRQGLPSENCWACRSVRRLEPSPQGPELFSGPPSLLAGAAAAECWEWLGGGVLTPGGWSSGNLAGPLPFPGPQET